MNELEAMKSAFAAAGVEMVEYPEYGGTTMERRLGNHRCEVPPSLNERILSESAKVIRENREKLAALIAKDIP